MENSEETNLTGKEKRALRSFAGQQKSKGKMFTINYAGGADEEIAENFVRELETGLEAHELINIKMLYLKKKKLAKEVGEAMAQATQSKLVQVIGHSVLLYKPSKRQKIDLNLLLVASSETDSN
eukprot:CAMPEP_0117756856 /NCGR_PEP_ID=MMETSP0947-20121206/14352_1 /TAXON_ID=44440 /ORGANISM="Chattonella subsalsa, Strain CCMP2191" /LENGTH=123 /DNA_ID=CAMNT_0005576573 /DNA_START=419 /DNA_END=790 /DNA_ORIENTATION=+